MKIVTAADFEAEVLKSEKPVLVDFFATWCGPCKSLAPILEQIAAEKADSLKIVKVDVDASPELAAEYGIRAMPTMMIFKDGDVVATKVGGAPKSALVKWIDGALSAQKISLSADDKKRLTDAFNDAVNASPDADTPTTLLTRDGSETTLRKAIEKELKDGTVFKQVEMLLNATQMPLDAFITGLKKSGLALPKPPKP
ncbi:MAG: thioredoxin [Alphaproteobacteria bacterium]|nr:thioredoxin [Alphaproteobacteria bacterium]